MNAKVSVYIRWFALLPGAILGAMLSLFLLHLTLYNTLSHFVSPYPEMPERILTPLCFTVSFIWLSYQIAPNNKFITSLVFFGISIFLSGGVIISGLTGGSLGGNKLSMQYGGFPAAIGIVGAFIGLFLVYPFKQLKEIKTTSDESSSDSNSKPTNPAQISFFKKHSELLTGLLFLIAYSTSLIIVKVRLFVFAISLFIFLIGLILEIVIVKEKYETKDKRIELVRNILFSIALLTGLLNDFLGFYASLFCLLLITYGIVKLVVIKYFRMKSDH